MISEKESLKQTAMAAQKREMEATKQLALASKAGHPRAVGRPGRFKPSPVAEERKPSAGRVRQAKHGQDKRGEAGHVLVGKCPRSDLSRIPLPRALPQEYVRKLEAMAQVA